MAAGGGGRAGVLAWVPPGWLPIVAGAREPVVATGADFSRRTLGPMRQMSDTEWREFVMTGTRTGKVGVTRVDGRAHVTPVWFVLDRDDLVFTTEESSAKAKALRRSRAGRAVRR